MKSRLAAGLMVALAVIFASNWTWAQTIKIGAIYPFTGPGAVHAEDAKRALDFAQDEINAAGGINGKEVKFIYEDDANTPKGGVSAAQKLIDIDKVDSIVGCLFSSVVLAVKPILNTSKTVLVAPMATNPKIYADTKYIFSLTPTDNDSCYVIAKYNTQVLKKKSLGTLYAMNDSGTSGEELISKWWEHFGGKTLIRESFMPASTDFRTQLTKIRAAGPEVLYFNGTWREGGNVLKQLTEMNLMVQVTASSYVREPKLLELAGIGAEGMVFSTSSIGKRDEDKRLKEEFERKFTAKYKQPPAIVGWNSYDCARVIFEALKKGATKGDSLRDTIAKLDIPGVFGRIRFREDGSPIKETEMWIVKNGQFVDLNYVDHAP